MGAVHLLYISAIWYVVYSELYWEYEFLGIRQIFYWHPIVTSCASVHVHFFLLLKSVKSFHGPHNSLGMPYPPLTYLPLYNSVTSAAPNPPFTGRHYNIMQPMDWSMPMSHDSLVAMLP